MIDYIQKGGLLMWPILACSIISIAVFAERLLYLHRATIHVGEFLKGLSNLIRRRNFAEALHESAGTPGPVARVIHAAIIRHDAPRAELRDIVQEAAQLEVPKLERFLEVLATIAYEVIEADLFRQMAVGGSFDEKFARHVVDDLVLPALINYRKGET